MSKHKSARRPARAPNQSIHPRGAGGEKSNTAAPRRQRAATEAHRRHVQEHPTDAMSVARLALLDSGKA